MKLALIFRVIFYLTIALSYSLGAMDNLADDDEQRTLLSELKNFTRYPGEHTKLSPLPGSRNNELEIIRKNIDIFQVLQKEIYKKQKLHIIPLQFREHADAISKKILVDYLAKYLDFNVNIDNVVKWSTLGLVKTDVCDVENKYNTWKIYALVEKPESEYYVKNNLYCPAYIVALHEVMHLEEVDRGICSVVYNSRIGLIDEVLTVTKTLILLDKVYKEVMGISSEEEVDYGVSFDLFGRKISQGSLAKFYGNLESKYKNLAEALISAESLEFLGCLSKVSPDKRPSIAALEYPSSYSGYLPSLKNKDDEDYLPRMSLRLPKSKPEKLFLEGANLSKPLLSTPDLFPGTVKWIKNQNDMQDFDYLDFD